MARINYQRVIFISTVISLFVIYLILWIGMVKDPYQYTGTDYVTFYSAAKIANEISPSEVYDLQLQQKYEQELGNFDISFNEIRIFLNPPFVIPLAQLSILPSFLHSLFLWQAFMFFHLIAGIILIISICKVHFSKKILLIFITGILFFFPGYQSWISGQNSLMFFLGACIWFYGVIMKKDQIGGIGLALMAVRPHLALPLALPYLFKQRKIFLWFCICVLVLLLFSIFYVGVDGIIGFINIISLSASGKNLTTGENHMVNLVGVLIRLFPFVPVITFRWIGWIIYLFTIISLCIVWARSSNITSKQVGLAILFVTFTAPHMHLHDLVIWSIPLVIILLSIKTDPKKVVAASALPWFLSMAFLLCYISSVFEATIPYFIMVLLIVLLIHPEKIPSKYPLMISS